MKACRYLSYLCSLAFLAPGTAAAVCFYPNSDRSGYTIPLEAEVRTSPAIVFGEVTAVREIFEDPADPESTSAYVYTIHVSHRFKGRTPDLITVRTQNDSGGYRMGLGERHLLLLTRKGEAYSVNSCGNSAELPQGPGLAPRV